MCIFFSCEHIIYNMSSLSRRGSIWSRLATNTRNRIHLVSFRTCLCTCGKEATAVVGERGVDLRDSKAERVSQPFFSQGRHVVLCYFFGCGDTRQDNTNASMICMLCNIIDVPFLLRSLTTHLGGRILGRIHNSRCVNVQTKIQNEFGRFPPTRVRGGFLSMPHEIHPRVSQDKAVVAGKAGRPDVAIHWLTTLPSRQIGGEIAPFVPSFGSALLSFFSFCFPTFILFIAGEIRTQQKCLGPTRMLVDEIRSIR